MSARIARAAAPLLLIAVAGSGCTLLDDAHSRQQIDVEGFADEHWQDWEPMSGLEVRSDELCAGLDGCLQGVASEHLVVLKFDGVDSASAYVGEGHPLLQQIDPLVVDFRAGDLSAADREAVLETLSNINASSPD